MSGDYVPNALETAAGIYRERNAAYGDNYKRFGIGLKGMFPNGLTLETEDDFNRFAVFVFAYSKVTRYAQQFSAGGHPDSLDDLSVYSMMLRELDADLAERKGAEEKRKSRQRDYGAAYCDPAMTPEVYAGPPGSVPEVCRVVTPIRHTAIVASELPGGTYAADRAAAIPNPFNKILSPEFTNVTLAPGEFEPRE